MFLTFEGIDGAGKSSHIEPLAAMLRSAGHVVTLTRELGGTPLAESLRAMVLSEPMDMMSEVLLAFAARRDHVKNVIEPGLARGEIILCDRFTDSSFAYQGGGRGVDLDCLRTLESWVHGGLQPDCTLWFDLDPTEAARRRSAVRLADRFESQDIEFFTRVRNAYLERSREFPERFFRIDASLPIQDVWACIAAEVPARVLACRPPEAAPTQPGRNRC